MISWHKDSPHVHPKAQRAETPTPRLSRPPLLHFLAFRLIDGCRRWKVTL